MRSPSWLGASAWCFVVVDINIQSAELPLPTFWSGSACRIEVEALTIATQGGDPTPIEPTILEAKLFLEQMSPHYPGAVERSEMVKHWQAAEGLNGPVPTFGIGGGWMFDSLEFRHGRELRVRVWVKEVGNVITEETDSTTVYNRAFELCHEDSSKNGSDEIHAEMAGFFDYENYLLARYHAIYGEDGTYWDDVDGHHAILNATMLYIDTHGRLAYPDWDETVFFSASEGGGGVDAIPSPVGGHGTSPFAIDLTINSVGQGPPPFQSGRPTTRVAYLDFCNSSPFVGNDPPVFRNDFAEALLWPYYNFYQGWTENQATIGWSGGSGWPSSTSIAYDMFQYMLQERMDVRTARIEIGEPVISNQGTMIIFGDFRARLRGVYYPYANPDGRGQLCDFDNDGQHDWIRELP